MIYTYKKNSTTAKEIYTHLYLCKDHFNPPLATSNVENTIKDYAKKIKDNAITFEAWDENTLISLVAIYLNDLNTKIGFITNVSTLPTYQGRGLGSQLINSSLNNAKDLNFYTIRLEVGINNVPAISLYSKLGFNKISINKDKQLMEKILST